MPKGRRGKRTKKRKIPTIYVRWKGVIILSGPANNEVWLRERLEQKLSNSLHRCPYLSVSGLADRYAFKIAWSAKFLESKKYKRGIIRVKKLDVVYFNPGSYWKWWSRWRDNRDTLVITGDRYHEDTSWLPW